MHSAMECVQVCSLIGEVITSLPPHACANSIAVVRKDVALAFGCDVGNVTLVLDSHVLTDDETLDSYLKKNSCASKDIVCIQSTTFESCGGTWYQIQPVVSTPHSFDITKGVITAPDGREEVVEELDEQTLAINIGKERYTGSLVNGNLVWTEVTDPTNRCVLARQVLECAIVKVEDQRMERCCVCHGSGRLLDDQCPLCDGADVSQGRLRCAVCDGSGFLLADQCPLCDGVREGQEISVTLPPQHTLVVGDSSTGKVSKVIDGTVQKAGVKPGWFIVKIDGMAYAEELLVEKFCGSLPYTMTFREYGMAS